ncbi:MAG: class I SAM-dependent methyltransferase [Thermodesulfobacteriota bacterium]
MSDKDRDYVEKVEAWYRGRVGLEYFRLQRSLIWRLLEPRPGERLLDVGCGAGHHLLFFQREGLFVAGLDPSPAMLEAARARLGRGADLRGGRAEDLPFSDNEFDVVTLIYCLEAVSDPEAAVAEAFRVARRRVFIGVNNPLSLDILSFRVREFWSGASKDQVRYYTLWELLNLVRRIGGAARIRWASVGQLPRFLAGRAYSFESFPLIQRSPFGAFLGLAAPVTGALRMDNLTIKVKPALAGAKVPAPTPTTCGPWGRTALVVAQPEGASREVRP